MAFSVELPKSSDPPEIQEEKLDKLAEAFGPEEFFNFKRVLTDNKNPVVGKFHERQAAQLLRDEMAADPTIDFDQARRRLAYKLGYNELTRTNLYKLIEAGLVHLNRQDLKKHKPKKRRELAAV